MPFQVFDLRCEYAENPLGIGTPAPRLSWKLTHPERNQRQTAYQVIAAHRPEDLDLGAPFLLWDSGKVPSAETVAVPYGGAPLQSRERVYWRVRAWDAQDRPSPWSAPAWFEAALLQPEDWQAVWIGYPQAWPGRALYFRYRFQVDKAVTSARLYAAGLGYHEFYLNGVRLGDAVLDPAYTDASRRVLYRTFDLEPYLQPGANCLAAVVGSGWHGCPKLLAQIELRFADGASACHASGPAGDWLVGPGPIVSQSLYHGEVYDAREELPGWNLPTAQSGGEWTRAVHVPAPGGRLEPQMVEPIRVMGELAPQKITEPRPGVYVVDFGQNFAGWAQLRVQGERGTRVTLRFAETLYEDGTINQENLRQAACSDVYILKGEGEEVWEPRFTYHGFRYVQVEGFPGAMTAQALTGKVVRSAVEEAGQFTCSHDLLNRIHAMVRWTEASNLHGVPTDCPQRNERMGWLNDMAARAEESFLNFRQARLLAKWIGDIYDAQDPQTGAIPDTAPWSWGWRPADPVSVCYLEVAWLLYAHYGDRRTLEAYYPGFCRWLDCLSGMAQGHIISFSKWGDWAPPAAQTLAGTPRHKDAPGDLVSTAFYYHTCRLLARIAGILGREADRCRYEDLATRIAEAFNARYWDESVGGYGTNSQSCNALALGLGLVPEARRGRVVANLARDVLELHEGHLTTGNIGTKYLLEALAAGGRPEVALTLATQATYPSWGFMLANGATTLWERWELYTGGGMNSHNHPMLGSIGSWLYKALAGILLTPQTVAWDRFVLRPYFAPELDHVAAAHETVRGTIRSAWRREGGRVLWEVGIPVGSQAELVLPAAGRVSEGGLCLWDGQKPAQRAPGITLLQHDAQTVTLGVGSGRYGFVWEGQ